MTNSLSIDPQTLARIDAEATALPKGWARQPSSDAPDRARYESRYGRWTLRIDVFAMAGRQDLAFEAVLLSDRPLLPARADTLLVATLAPNDRSIGQAFDGVWQAVAGRRDIESAAHRECRRRRAAGRAPDGVHHYSRPDPILQRLPISALRSLFSHRALRARRVPGRPDSTDEHIRRNIAKRYEPFEGPAMNPKMKQLVDDLQDWRKRYSGATETREAAQALKDLLCPNEEEFRAALAAVDKLTYGEMTDLLRDHRELNAPEGVQVEYASQLVDAYCDPNDAGDWTIFDTDDYVNMLTRVVEYAKYL